MNSGFMKTLMQAILLPLLLFSSCIVSLPLEFDYSGDSYSLPMYTYDRFPEVKLHCARVLPVLAELKPDDTRGYRIINELGFEYGDWSQEPDAGPLIPWKYKQNDGSHFNPSTNLVSFLVMDVDSLRRSDNMISVSGMLKMNSETTQIRIFFEGVYVESDENGGERHMCLLATSWMPDSLASFIHVDRDNSSFGEDDQIMLLLRYPKTFTLTTRRIHGEMTSLATQPDLDYFGKVSISSLLNERGSRYQFGSAQVFKACSPYKDSEIWFHGDSVIFQGKDFCKHLQGISMQAKFKINPNHTSFVQDGILGSFVLDKEKSRDLNFGNLKLVLRNFICRPGYHGINTANVSAEFTVSMDHSWSNGPTRNRIGLSGKSIFAEGIWSSSEKELCMVGCLVENDKDSIMCDYRVSLFFPTAFSIHRRSLVYGSITDINAESESDGTVLIENELSSPGHFLHWANFYTAYDYSKLSLASAFKSKHQLSSLVQKLRRTLFEYPSYIVDNHHDVLVLPGDLTVRSTAVACSSEDFKACKCSEEFEACKSLSVDLLFGHRHIHISPPAENQDYSEIRTVVLSGYISITGKGFNSVSLSVEGLYDPTIGTMHLIGCRDLRAFPSENIESLEQGQDCMIEIEVEYPPTNFRYLLNQKLKISISSRREKKDSSYISPMVIWTQPIAYSWLSDQKQFIMSYEKHLRSILLLMGLYCTSYQIKYMNSAQGESSSSYISLIMLGIQISSYLFSFITLLDVANPSAHSDNSYIAMFSEIDILIKMELLMMTASNIFRIFRLVRTSRAKPNSASDVKVLIVTLSVHALGLSIFLNHSNTGLGKLSIQFKQIEIYCGLVHSLFLLPQIIANKLRQVRSKPLRKTYYIGLSLITSFPYLHNYLRDPQYATTGEDQAAVRLNFLNRYSDIGIAMTVILLAFVVHIQQIWSSGSQPELASETASLIDEKDSSESN